jgi:LacI family transcriptional regulator
MKPSKPTDRGKQHFRVGVRLPAWGVGYCFRIFDGLLDFQRTGQAMRLHFDQFSGGDLASDPVNQHWIGDGLIVYRHTKKEAKAWSEAGIPVVNLSMEYPGSQPDFPTVTMDPLMVGKMAFEHLSMLGLKDFAFIHESTRRYSKERLEAFREAVIKNGGRFHQIDVPVSSFPIPTRPDEIERCLRAPLLALPRPCGILTKDDIAGIFTLRMMEKLGIDCPHEMPVLGVTDDIAFCHAAHPPLSSISYPARKIGYTAANLLMQMMLGKKIPANKRLVIPPSSLASRESTRHVILKDQVVTRAMNHIRNIIPNHALSVTELSQTVGVSREGLRQRFLKSLGRTPKQEIQRLRCFHITEHLRNQELTLDTIAEQCGFSGPDEVCRFIKRMTGKTPGEIRKNSLR